VSRPTARGAMQRLTRTGIVRFTEGSGPKPDSVELTDDFAELRGAPLLASPNRSHGRSYLKESGKGAGNNSEFAPEPLTPENPVSMLKDSTTSCKSEEKSDSEGVSCPFPKIFQQAETETDRETANAVASDRMRQALATLAPEGDDDLGQIEAEIAEE